MIVTIHIDDDLFKKAADLTGIKDGCGSVSLGLEALIARESGKRLAKLGEATRRFRRFPAEEGWLAAHQYGGSTGAEREAGSQSPKTSTLASCLGDSSG